MAITLDTGKMLPPTTLRNSNGTYPVESMGSANACAGPSYDCDSLVPEMALGTDKKRRLGRSQSKIS